MTQKYAFQGREQGTAKAFGRRMPISTKHSIMVCRAIKGKTVDRARTILEGARDKEEPIKFTKFSEGAGHKPGKGMAKYPVKACKEILKVLNSAEANAQNEGLGADLEVVHAAANQASRGYKYGRHRGRKEKSTHVEIVVREIGGTIEEPEETAEEPEDSDEPSEEESQEEKTEEEQIDKEVPSRSTVSNMTKDEIKEYADEEWDVELSTNDLKDEMIDQLFEEIGDGDD